MNFIESLQDFVLGLPDTIQFLGVALAAMVPFVENYGAVIIGSIAGIPIWATVAMAVIGNVAVIALVTLIAGSTRDAVLARKANSSQNASVDSGKRQRVRQLFDRYGIPGVTIFGMLLVPTHFIAVALVSFGCSRTGVIVWHAIAITLYAVLTGGLMVGLFSLSGV